MIDAIFQELCQPGSSVVSPEVWETLPPDDQHVDVDCAGVESLGHLQRSYCQSDLHAAGVISNGDGESVKFLCRTGPRHG